MTREKQVIGRNGRFYGMVKHVGRYCCAYRT